MGTTDQQTTAGWIVFIAALGMMFGMLAVDIAQLTEWSQATKPVFIGSTIWAFVGGDGAFVGGKIIPESREHAMKTREDDP